MEIIILIGLKNKEAILLKAKDIMSKNVAYVNPNATITEAAQLMQKI